MDSSLMMILMLSFTSVTTEKQKPEGSTGKDINGKETVEAVPFPDASPIFTRVEKINMKNEAVPSNDAEIFWEVTKSPERLKKKSDFVNGNHPDNYEITTHDHVDQTIGHVPPTKRVKKILPPFKEKRLRNARHIYKETKHSSSQVTKEKQKTTDETSSNQTPTQPGEQTEQTTITSTFLETKSKLEDVSLIYQETPETTPENFKSAYLSLVDKETTTEKNEIQNSKLLVPKIDIEAGDVSPSQSTDLNDEEIEGIRLVPDEFGFVLPNGKQEDVVEERVDKKPTMQKSIWDLLKEREQFNTDANHLDGEAELEISKNDTEENLTKLPTTKSLYEHFDADSAEVEFETSNFKRGYSNIEKHELPLSYAMSWLQIKDKDQETNRSNETQEKKKKKQELPQEVSNLLQMSQNEKSGNGVTVSIINSGSGSDLVKYGHRSSRWYLLLLTGNSTIVKLRRKDFTKYLKLNLAARLSVEYDDVRVNKVILAPPKVLVNISVFAPSDEAAEESQLDLKQKPNDNGEAPLYKLAETNATLLELSGEEYHVVRFLSLQSENPEAEAQKNAVPDPVAIASRHDDVEFVVFTFLGSAGACAVILVFFVAINRYFKRVSDVDWSRFRAKQSAWKLREEGESEKDEFNGVSPAVIYSGGFPQIRGSWMSGVGSRHLGSAVVHQYPGIEMGGSPLQRKKPFIYPELEERPCNSPRHSKLQIYNCDAESLLIPMPLQNKAIAKGKLEKSEGSDTHPLDVRIGAEKTGQDNPIFTN